MRGGRCAAPTPKLSSALIDAQADRRGWSNADPPDAGQGALAMPLVGLGECSTTREAMTFPLLSLMTLSTMALEWVRGSCAASSTDDCQLVPDVSR